MNVTTDDLQSIIGLQTIELFALRRRVAELEAQFPLPSAGNTLVFPNPPEDDES